MCTSPHTFQCLYVLDSGRISGRSNCGESFENVKISDLDFADYAVIFVKTLDMFLGALEVLNEELEPLRLRVSWLKARIQAFNDILDAVVLSVSVCGEDLEVIERCIYLGSDIHVSTCCSWTSIDIWIRPGESWI